MPAVPSTLLASMKSVKLAMLAVSDTENSDLYKLTGCKHNNISSVFSPFFLFQFCTKSDIFAAVDDNEDDSNNNLRLSRLRHRLTAQPYKD